MPPPIFFAFNLFKAELIVFVFSEGTPGFFCSLKSFKVFLFLSFFILDFKYCCAATPAAPTPKAILPILVALTAFAAPAKRNEPFSLDMATSTVAVGKLQIARRAGKELPLGWAHDAEGHPTSDPAAALAATPKRLSPLGGSRDLGSHKGYGLAMMVEILSSVLSGSFIGGYNLKSDEREQYINVGHFCLALNPAGFREEGEFEDNLDDLIDMLHGTDPVDPAQPVLVAGDPEHRERARRLVEGIPMTDTLYKEVRAVAESCGAPFILGND